MDDTTPKRLGPGRPPGITGIPTTIDRRCSCCGGSFARNELHEKVVQFRPLADRNRTTRSRTVGWLCGGCMLVDSDFNRPAKRRPHAAAEATS